MVQEYTGQVEGRCLFELLLDNSQVFICAREELLA
jgi:hypothetical protein